MNWYLPSCAQQFSMNSAAFFKPLCGLQRTDLSYLIFSRPEEFANTASCQKYFQLVGQANVDLQPRGSSKRQSLVDSALACLVNWYFIH